ncbi:unnamed protein product, partial [Rotaria socialis]
MGNHMDIRDDPDILKQ